MTEEQRKTSQLVATWAQFVAMLVVFGSILVYMGRKDQQLIQTGEQVKELSSIVSDLAKANIGLTLKGTQTDDRLSQLSARLDRLERYSK